VEALLAAAASPEPPPIDELVPDPLLRDELPEDLPWLLRLPGIQRELADKNGPLSPALQQRLAEPLFLVSIQIRTAIALGIVFLMTVKPDVLGSAIAIAVAIVLGVGFSLPVLNRARGRASKEALARAE